VSRLVGSMVEACCAKPIEVIKMRLQLDKVGKYKGFFHYDTIVVKPEGVRALWSGLTPFVMHLTTKYSLRMGSNSMLQGAFLDPFIGNPRNSSRVMGFFSPQACRDI
jgi:solute carrier family 25 citrate transporter 1